MTSSDVSLLRLQEKHMLVPVVETRLQFVQALQMSMVRAMLLQHCNVFAFAELAESAARAGRARYLNMDQSDGVYADEAGFGYLRERFQVKGIISSHPKALVVAKQAGLESIQRIFALDSTGLEIALASVDTHVVDMLDFVPARIVPHIIPDLRTSLPLPYMASGWLRNAEQLQAILASGVRAVTVMHLEKWV